MDICGRQAFGGREQRDSGKDVSGLCRAQSAPRAGRD